MSKLKKVLFTATVDSHILQFHIPYLKLFKECGYEVHIATNGEEKIPYCDIKHKVSFERNPFKLSNLKAIKELEKIINNEEFEIIHCHTPMGSVITRLAAIKARQKYNTRVIYTAHGFHFYEGASKLNWLIYYPIEKYLSKYTDTLITINKEDYNLAKGKFNCKDVQYIEGVGIDLQKFEIELNDVEKNGIKLELGLNSNDILAIYVAEFIKRKNHIMAIQVFSDIIQQNPNIKLLLVGNGELLDKCKQTVKEMNLSDNVIFLGYRKDVPLLMKISDIAISTSLQEGLPVNVLEAMASGLPVVATNCRGNRDLIEDGQNGKLVEINDIIKMKDLIINLVNDADLYKYYSDNTMKKVLLYKLDNILKQIKLIYFNK